MKRLLILSAFVCLGPLAVAQTSPQQSDPARTPSTTGPSSSMQNPTNSGTGNYSNGSDDNKLQIKACLAKQQKANPQLSEAEMKRNCAKFKPKNEEDR